MYNFTTKLVSGLLGNTTRGEEDLAAGSSSAPVDLTEDNDEDKTARPKTRSPLLPPSLPPRRRNYDAGAPREQIVDLFPEPPIQIRTYAGSTEARLKRIPEMNDELEKRLLGNYVAPRGAVPISIPGSAPRTTAKPPPTTPKSRAEITQMSRKPGSGGNFQPKNTLNETRYKGQARGANGARRQGTTLHPNGLTLESSRGGNVRMGQSDFQDSDRPMKRQRLEQPSKVSTSKTSPRLHDNVTEEIVRPPTATRRSMPSWEPSGPQESRQVEMLLERSRRQQQARESEARMAQRGGEAARAAPIATSKPSPRLEVHEISDDDRPAQTQPSPRGHGRPPKRPVDQDDDVIETGAKRRGNVKSALSPYFSVDSTKGARKANATQTVDLDHTEEAPATSLKTSILEVLGSSSDLPPDHTVKNPRQMTEGSEGEDEIARNPPKSPRKSSPSKAIPSNAHLTARQKPAVDSDERDELDADINNAVSVRNGKSGAKKPTAPPPRRGAKQNTVAKNGFLITKLVNSDGHLWEGRWQFLELRFSSGISYDQYVILYDQDGKKFEPGFSMDPRQIRKAMYSHEDDSLLMRLELSGRGRIDVEFHDRNTLKGFLEAVKHITTIKNEVDRAATYMKAIFGKRDPVRQSPDEPVDRGQEDELLARRVGQDRPTTSALKRDNPEGGRPRHRYGLISEMKTQESPEQESAQSSPPDQGRRRSTRRNIEVEISPPPVAYDRPTRTSTRARKTKLPTPEPQFERFSKVQGLGEAWDQPLVYPEVGKKRVTVDFTDLERLDEGEFLNDNLLEFYIRWLQENRKVKPQTAYFFGTHFYTTLSDTSSAPKGQINFSAVERWTAKDDIFSHDFVIVPVNEMMHWYLAIICNLPNVVRKFESAGDGSTEASSKVQSQANDASSQPIEIVETPDVEEPATTEVDIRDSSRSTPTRNLSRQFGEMKTTSPTPQVSDRTEAHDRNTPKIVIETEKTIDLDSLESKRLAGEEIQLSAEVIASQPNTSQVSDGVLSNAPLLSPEKKRKGKRKSGPPPRKYDVEKPMIVIMDPMGTAHQRTTKILKEYLVLEAQQKRSMNIDRETFQGMTARSGIPQQDNYYDCGIYVLGYLDKFMQDPYAFGRKLLAQEFDLELDWPEMQSGIMRAQMRSMLQGLAKEQQEARAAKKAEKRAAKRHATAAAAAAPPTAPPVSSPPKLPSSTPANVIDLSSPAKPRVAQPKSEVDQKATLPKAAARQTTKSPPKQGCPPTAATVVEEYGDDDELLFDTFEAREKEKSNFLQKLVDAAGGGNYKLQEQSSQPQFYVPDSQSQGKTNLDNDFKIYEDQAKASEAGTAQK